MMESLTIFQAGEELLEFSGNVPRGLTGYDEFTFLARVTSVGLSAQVLVRDIQPQRWSGFFEHLAANWRGWPGESALESIEHHLRITAAHDGVGHVQLRVHIRDEPVSSWRVEADFYLELGQLEDLARRARAFFG